MVFNVFRRAMNLTLLPGTHIRPTARQAQKILATNITSKMGGISANSVALNGNKKDMIVMIPLVLFSTTMARFSYHSNLFLTSPASLYWLNIKFRPKNMLPNTHGKYEIIQMKEIKIEKIDNNDIPYSNCNIIC